MAQAGHLLTADALNLLARSNESSISSTSTTNMMIDGVDFALCDDDDQLSVLSDSSHQR